MVYITKKNPRNTKLCQPGCSNPTVMMVVLPAAPKLSMGENPVMLNIQQPSCFQVAGEWVQKDLIECTNSFSP